MADKLAKKKKSIFKRWWFWVIAVIVLFALVPTDDAEEGASESDKAPKTAVESESEEEGAEAVVEEEEAPEEVAEPEPEAPGIGDVVKVGDFEVTLHGSSTASNVGGEYGQNAQGTFLLVELTIKNIGNKAVTVDSSQFKLLHDGVEFNSDGTAALYANDDNSLFLTSINPGNSITSILPFDVSEEAANSDGLVVQISEGLFSSKSANIELK